MRTTPMADREPTAGEFFARWAQDGANPFGGPVDSSAAPALTSDDLVAIGRLVAPLFGDRPLGGVTLGELAGLPALLESRGVPPEASRAACRALGNALRSAILALPDTPRPAS
ncbi:MAG TPA: hypothetical protein VFJ74_12180 [Gemmatimonadaceae bacterium]|nr:hypothetical protein [Gemmatimonadaceae bacterium]